MRYRFSDAYTRDKTSAGRLTFRLIGLGLVGLLASGPQWWMLWAEQPSSRGHWVAFVLGIVTLGFLLSALIIGIRRLFVPPAPLIKAATFEIDRHGLWRETPKSRDLLFGAHEMAVIQVHRTSTLADPVRIELHGPVRRLEVHSLDSMWTFLEELKAAFPAARVEEVPLSWGPSRVQESGDA
jgi:hypothetical protein